MKKLVLSLLVGLNMVGSADSLHPDTFKKVIQLTPSRSFQNLVDFQIASGTYKLDQMSGEVEVTLVSRIPCTADGKICAAVMPITETFFARVVSTYTDRCNNLVVEAEKDMRPADGALTRISMIDRTNTRCPNMNPSIYLAPYSVHIQETFFQIDLVKEAYLNGYPMMY